MNTIEMCNTEDYKSLEALANVEEKLILYINSRHLPLYQLDCRDRSFIGRHLTVLQAFVIANEINRSISFLSQILSQLNSDLTEESHTLKVKNMRTFINRRASYSEYWVQGRLNY